MERFAKRMGFSKDREMARAIQPFQPKTIGELLARAYGSLAMAAQALHSRQWRYGRVHYMIRSRLYREFVAGRASPASVLFDQKVRLRLPAECVYCGSTDHPAIDHVISRARGGADSADNSVRSCRSCNSSKSKDDLFAWWQKSRTGFPPLFVVRIYLKQAYAYFKAAHALETTWPSDLASPFSLAHVPLDYPSPALLMFTAWHHRRRMEEESSEAARSHPLPENV